MKDSLLEMLMNFFEKSLSQLKERNFVEPCGKQSMQNNIESYDVSTIESRTLVIKAQKNTATRIFAYDEVQKLSKASQQLLLRLMSFEIVASETLELIINQLLFSDSRKVSLEETKWTIRNTLAENLDAAQLAFLDLLLYEKTSSSLLH